MCQLTDLHVQLYKKVPCHSESTSARHGMESSLRSWADPIFTIPEAIHLRRTYLVQELSGKDSFWIPLLLQCPQLIQFTLAPEAKLYWASSGCILEVGVLGLVRAPRDGNALGVQLGNPLRALSIRIPYDVIPETESLVKLILVIRVIVGRDLLPVSDVMKRVCRFKRRLFWRPWIPSEIVRRIDGIRALFDKAFPHADRVEESLGIEASQPHSAKRLEATLGLQRLAAVTDVLDRDRSTISNQG